MENLRVSLLQAELAWEDKAANLQRFGEKLFSDISQQLLCIQMRRANAAIN